MRDIRAIKDLKYSSWVNMYQLTATESQKGRYRIEGFFKQFYDHDTRNVLKTTLNNDIPPFRPAVTHQVAAESTAFSHEIVQSLASNNNNVPLKAGRLSNILSRYGHGPPIPPPPTDEHSDPVPHSSHASPTHQVTNQRTETTALAFQQASSVLACDPSPAPTHQQAADPTTALPNLELASKLCIGSREVKSQVETI